MTCSASSVFCDNLAVSYKPDGEGQESNSPSTEVLAFLQENLRVCTEYAKGHVLLRLLEEVSGFTKVTTGTALLKERQNCTIISLSGRLLKELRDRDLFGSLLNIMSSKPYSVTRLDASKDYYKDAVPVLRSLKRRFPREIHFTHKPVKTTWYMGTRFDGKESGSFYGGLNSKARVACLVYDKSKERHDKTGELIPPCTRYEMKFSKRDLGMTLKDAYNPTELFWEYSKVLGIKPDVALSGWRPYGEYVQWVGAQREAKTDAMKLNQLLEYSSDVDRFIELVDRNGAYGRTLLESRLEAKRSARVGGSPRMTDSLPLGDIQLSS